MEQIKPGDLYEDGASHACVCMGVESDHVWGISLMDGSYPRVRDRVAGGVRKLSVEEAWTMRLEFGRRVSRS